MHRRQPLPRLWLMTDERQGEALWTALERVPRRSGVVFRHYSLESGERRRLFDRVKRVATGKQLLLILAGPPQLARLWGADGAHGRWRKVPGLILTTPAHDMPEIRAAERLGADLLFVSPAFVTRSHEGKQPLGPLRFGLLAARSSVPVIALGGMDGRRARRLRRVYGWAGIDCWNA